MKKICLIILFVFLLPVTSSFAIAPPTATGQRIFVPYVQVGGGWCSGLAIHNLTVSTINITLTVRESPSTYEYVSIFTVASFDMKVDLLENFFSDLPPSGRPSGRMSVWIECSANGSSPFQATLFIGNDQGGFGFNNYKSEAYTYTLPLIGSAPGD